MSTATSGGDVHTGDAQRLQFHRVAALDGLRAIAVAMVFAFHIDSSAIPGGYQGVMLFFALSGFLITTLLLQEWRDTSRIQLRAFYARRFLRLMPALLVMVVVTVAASVVLGTFTVTTMKDAASGLGYVMDIYAPASHTIGGGYAHTWSLAVEEQFYLIWPAVLVFTLTRRRNLLRVVIGWMLALTALTAVLAMTDVVYRGGMYRLPTTQFPVIGAGIVLAVVLDGPRGAWLLRVLARPVVPAVAIVGAIALLFTTPHGADWLYLGGYPAVGLMFAALIGTVLAVPGSAVTRALSVRPLVWLGRRSYGFYLWHVPVIYLLAAHTHSRLVEGVVALTLSLIATALSWRLVETPFLRLKRRFERAAADLDELVPVQPVGLPADGGVVVAGPAALVGGLEVH